MQDREQDFDTEEAIASIDLQKIMSCHTCLGLKKCRQLVQFHQTFASLGGKKKCPEPAMGWVFCSVVVEYLVSEYKYEYEYLASEYKYEYEYSPFEYEYEYPSTVLIFIKF